MPNMYCYIHSYNPHKYHNSHHLDYNYNCIHHKHHYHDHNNNTSSPARAPRATATR